MGGAPVYDHILVPISFDEEEGARQALDIARRLSGEGTQVTFLHVMEEIPGYAISYMPQDYLDESRKAITSDLQGRAAQIPGGHTVVIDGHSGRSILKWAEANHVDLIVVASHRPGLQDYFLGSTAAQIVRHAHCSVHVVR